MPPIWDFFKFKKKIKKMNRNILNEELDRIKLLYGYKTQKTLDENRSKILTNKLITERLASELVRGSETAVKELAMADRVALKAGVESAIAEIGKVTIMDGRGIPYATKNAEEIVLAMKEGRIAYAEAGKLAKEVFKTSTSLEVRSLAMDVITDTKSFSQRFGGKTRETIINELMNGPGKYTKAEAENLADNFLRKRKKLPTPIKVEPLKVEPYKPKVEPVKPKVEPIKPEATNVNTNNININLEGGGTRRFKNTEEFTNYMKGEGESWAKEYGNDFDNLAKEKGYKNFEEYMRADEAAAKNTVRESAKSGKGIFGRSLDWLKRNVSWRTIFGLAKIAGVGWLVWYLFFKDNGKKPECATGSHWEEGKGCIPDSGDTDGGGETDDGRTGGGGETDDGRTGGGDETKIVMDVEGNKYTECDPPYYKGCVSKKGNNDIREIQDCLGVTPNGFFNQETEDALKNKINKKSFTKSDIPTICARSYGASNFSY